MKFSLAELWKRVLLTNLLPTVVSLRLIFQKKENLKYFIVFIVRVAFLPHSFLQEQTSSFWN